MENRDKRHRRLLLLDAVKCAQERLDSPLHLSEYAVDEQLQQLTELRDVLSEVHVLLKRLRDDFGIL